MRHVVWDWNGTLFDDFGQVVAAVNHGLEGLGVGPITATDYRDHYTRPVKGFYEALLGRKVTDEEWASIDRRFHDAYRRRVGSARLAVGARMVLDRVAREGATQSLLSMYPHSDLLPLVERWELGGWFVVVQGLQGRAGDRKASHLAVHLQRLDLDPGRVLVVGDALDDAEAAAAVGARCILYDSGSHHRSHLHEAGVPVVESLLEVVDHL